jgi:hypothetical protein
MEISGKVDRGSLKKKKTREAKTKVPLVTELPSTERNAEDETVIHPIIWRGEPFGKQQLDIKNYHFIYLFESWIGFRVPVGLRIFSSGFL